MRQVPVSRSGSVQNRVETDIRPLNHSVAALLSQCSALSAVQTEDKVPLQQPGRWGGLQQPEE